MRKIYTLHKKNTKQYQLLRSLLRPHFIDIYTLPIVYKSELDLLAIIKKQDITEDVLSLKDGQLLVTNQSDAYIIHNPLGIRFLISDYILKSHTYLPSQLSIRNNELSILSEFEKDGSPCLSASPEEWIRGNPFFAALRPKPFYDRLLAHTQDKKGLFIKKWTLRAQHNYFHPSVNSGLPLTKKKDAIHEGTFMMHDMFHHVFKDALATGQETEEEKCVYIACRMMSEACTLVLADMIAVAHSKLEDQKYDIAKRQIYPLFKSLNLDPFDVETVRKLLYANSVYCLYGDTSVYKSLGASQESLNLYTSKYYKFFSGDFAWNEKNINNMISQVKNNTGLKNYFKSLDPSFSDFNTHTLAKQIKQPNGQLSFNKLFEIFWQQLVDVIYYQDRSNQLVRLKTCYTKYLSGQIKIAFEYSDLSTAKQLILLYPQVMEKITHAKKSEHVTRAGEKYIKQINSFIDELVSANTLTPVDSVINKLHVPLFPPEYVNYDATDKNFESLENISERILGKFLPKADFSYRPMPARLKKYYLKMVGN